MSDLPERRAQTNARPLSKSELNELVLRCAGEGIYCIDQGGRTTYLNPAGEAILGWKAEEFVGTFSHQLIHHTYPDGSAFPSHECPIYAAFHDGEVHHVDDEVFWRKDGTSFPVEYSSTPIIGDGGELLGAVVTFRDISERRAAEAEVARLTRNNELILASAGEGIYGLDAEGRATFCNPAAAAMMGWSVEEILGKHQHALIHHTRPDGDPYPRAECPIYAAITDGLVHREDNEVFWRKDGSSFPVEYVSTPVRDENGKLIGAVVTFNDISERKKREEALHNALAEVERLKERLQAENLYLRQEIKVSHNFEEIIGQGPAMTKAKRLIEQVAATDATVLILGETGVGKELFARAIHNLSWRRERPLIKVNCAALPSSLIESELFGHERGAFTGATVRRAGRFELANGGTIFLDEIGELPIELQAKLLRVIQEGEYERLGGSETIRTDIRIVAATHRDLRKMIQAGTFREDLFYRLNVFPVSVPALRDRREDIPQLVTHFVRKFAKQQGKAIENIPDHVQTALREYDWPGNIRELENVIERAVILSNQGTLRVDGAIAAQTKRSPDAEAAVPPGVDRRTLEEVERMHILYVLTLTSWRIAGDHGAAAILDMHPNTLRSRMAKLGIKKTASRPS
ncbi:MAG: sigma 54-interacting transcriptional regulator [Phycisphaerales bacterium]